MVARDRPGEANRFVVSQFPGKPEKDKGFGQLLKQQAGPESDRILISDIFRQLAGCLDQVALYGGGPDANQPTGQSMLAASPKVLQSIRPIYTVRFVRLKGQIETAIRNGRGGCNPPE